MPNVRCERRVKCRTTSSSVLSGSGRSSRSSAFGKNASSGLAASTYVFARPSSPISKISASDACRDIDYLFQSRRERGDIGRRREFGRVHQDRVGVLRIEAAERDAAEDIARLQFREYRLGRLMDVDNDLVEERAVEAQ